MIEAFLTGGAAFCLAATGFFLGVYVERRRHQHEAEFQKRMEPPSRTPGQPTNLTAPPSSVQSAKFRQGRWSSEGDMQS